MQNRRYPPGAGGEFVSEDVVFSFFIFLIYFFNLFYSCLAFPWQFSYIVSFTLLVTHALLWELLGW